LTVTQVFKARLVHAQGLWAKKQERKLNKNLTLTQVFKERLVHAQGFRATRRQTPVLRYSRPVRGGGMLLIVGLFWLCIRSLLTQRGIDSQFAAGALVLESQCLVLI
jgi:hypothetical protein